jgi:hypothetical protein
VTGAEEMGFEDEIQKLEASTKNIRFDYLLRVCQIYFGNARVKGSHHIFKTPWPGDPRINLQQEQGMAKPYQVRQVIEALRKLQELGEGKKEKGARHVAE